MTWLTGPEKVLLNRFMENLMEKIVSLAKRRGFIFPGSEIYGGLKGTWDYGPLGSELKFNFKEVLLFFQYVLLSYFQNQLNLCF